MPNRRHHSHSPLSCIAAHHPPLLHPHRSSHGTFLKTTTGAPTRVHQLSSMAVAMALYPAIAITFTIMCKCKTNQSTCFERINDERGPLMNRNIFAQQKYVHHNFVENVPSYAHYAFPMVHPTTGETISSYKRLMHDAATAEVWQTAFGKDVGGGYGTRL